MGTNKNNFIGFVIHIRFKNDSSFSYIAPQVNSDLMVRCSIRTYLFDDYFNVESTKDLIYTQIV